MALKPDVTSWNKAVAKGKENDINMEIIMSLNHKPYCLTAAAEDETSWKLLNLTLRLPGSF